MHPSFWTQVNHHTDIFLRRWGNSWSTQRKDKTWRSYPGPEGWLGTPCAYVLPVPSGTKVEFPHTSQRFWHQCTRPTKSWLWSIYSVRHIYIYFSLCFSRKGIFYLIIKGTTTHLRLQKKLDVFHLAKASFYEFLLLDGSQPQTQKKNNSIHPLNSSIQKHFWRREWQPTPVFLTGESHG